MHHENIEKCIKAIQTEVQGPSSLEDSESV